jgi:hypothetical protein
MHNDSTVDSTKSTTTNGRLDKVGHKLLARHFASAIEGATGLSFLFVVSVKLQTIMLVL